MQTFSFIASVTDEDYQQAKLAFVNAMTKVLADMSRFDELFVVEAEEYNGNDNDLDD